DRLRRRVPPRPRGRGAHGHRPGAAADRGGRRAPPLGGEPPGQGGPRRGGALPAGRRGDAADPGRTREDPGRPGPPRRTGRPGPGRRAARAQRHRSRLTRSPASLPFCQVVFTVSPVAPYNPNVPPPPNPYTRPGHGGGAARTPVRSSRAAVALHFLLGLGVMLFL